MTAAGLLEKRKRRGEQRQMARETRWENDRYAVPYRTDGPKISLGVLWFASMVAALRIDYRLAVLVALAVAGVAALQTGHAWSQHPRLAGVPVDRRASAILALVAGSGAVVGTFGLGVTVVMAAIGAVGYAALGIDLTAGSNGQGNRGRSPATTNERIIRFAELTIRSSIPVAVAAGAIGALGRIEPLAALSLLALVSAYEAGDFLVGTGSANAIEGPVAGIATLGVVAFALTLVRPEPFDGTSMLLFSVLAAVACPVGQIAGSAILPRGAAWAPALRRLDSYLIAAPLWLLLL